MSSSSSRRFSVLLGQLKLVESFEELLFLEKCETSSNENNKTSKITLGDISISIETNNNNQNSALELIPFSVAPIYFDLNDQTTNQEALRHLRWMFQKEQLGQDIFLLGPPSPYKRWLSMWFCELTQREVEYIALSRDLTESDIKQRREIRNKTVFYENQQAVRAALNGRILILDGMEKVERNVLPILNNLLENREMNLDDGSFLVSPQRFDSLANTKQSSKLLKVHPKFRVIALGIPTSRFPGNPLDPPLRSRFQCREISDPSIESYLPTLLSFAQTYGIDTNIVRQLSSLAEALKTLQSISSQSSSNSTSNNQNAGLTSNFLIPTSILNLPLFSSISLFDLVRLLSFFPFLLSSSSFSQYLEFIQRVFPYQFVCNAQEQLSVEAAITALLNNVQQNSIQQQSNSIENFSSDGKMATIQSIKFEKQEKNVNTYVCESKSHMGPIDFVVIGGSSQKSSKQINNNSKNTNSQMNRSSFIELQMHSLILQQMIEHHAIERDFCLIGPKGEGKTTLAHTFSKWLGYETMEIETMYLFKDMSARDLLQRRITHQNSDTDWEWSPIVRRAIHGGIVILDGIQRLHRGTLAVLQRIIQDRQLTLFDGTLLLREDQFEQAMRDLNVSDSQVLNRTKRVFSIHPNFRIVALATPPTAKNQWLTSEVMSLFCFNSVPSIPIEQQEHLLLELFPNAKHIVSKLLRFNSAVRQLVEQDILSKMQTNPEPELETNQTKKQSKKAPSKKSFISNSSLSESPLASLILSLRQLIMIVAQCFVFPEDLHHAISRSVLSSFLPSFAFQTLQNALEIANIKPKKKNTIQDFEIKSEFLVENGLKHTKLTIGDVSASVPIANDPSLIPQTLYFDIPEHTLILREMLKDFRLNYATLLIGTQGVGKNKLVDHLLQLLGIEREYIQLHRDTTIQSLTISANIKEGVVVWEDSPLVKAVKFGRTLVIDEADKAPIEVVTILKGLIEDSEMLLSDGRRIVGEKVGNEFQNKKKSEQELIVMNPRFHLIVLCNKPGFPFLGNDFYAELGDCFSCHAVENPSPESELKMLRAYAPNVSEKVILKLIDLFSDLRKMVAEGVYTYPYSLRELVAIVRHLEKYPNDGLVKALENVFAFDSPDLRLREQLSETFMKHGIPVFLFDSENGDGFRISLSERNQIQFDEIQTERSEISQTQTTTLNLESSVKLKSLTKWKLEESQKHQIKGKTIGRLHKFTELKSKWNVESGVCVSLCTMNVILGDGSLEEHLFVLTLDPFQIYRFVGPSFSSYSTIQLNSHIPLYSSEFKNFLSTQSTNDLPQLFSLENNSNKLILFIPVYSLALIIDVLTNVIEPCELPFDSNTRVSIWKDQVFLSRGSHTAKSDERLLLSSLNGTVALFLQKGKSRIVGIDFETRIANSWNLNFIPNQIVKGFSFPFVVDQVGSGDLWVGFDSLTSSQPQSEMKLFKISKSSFFEKPTTFFISNLSELIATSDKIHFCVSNSMEETKSLKFQMVLRKKQEQYLERKNFYLSKTSRLISQSKQKEERGHERDREANTNKYNGVEILNLNDFSFSTYNEFQDQQQTSNQLNTPYFNKHKFDIRMRPVFPPRNSHLSQTNLIGVSELGNSDLVLLRENGTIEILEMENEKLRNSLEIWKTLVGFSQIQQLQSSAENHLKLKTEFENDDENENEENEGKNERKGIAGRRRKPPPVVSPKVGINDGKVHVGGNTFEGGTGGSETAGMGGRGGPFRRKVSGGAKVTQMSEKEKQEVSEEAKKQARIMAEKSLKKQLEEIDMNEVEVDTYAKYVREISNEISSLKVILESVEARAKERIWASHQTAGEFDDRKNIEAITGERNIFKKRSEREPEPGAPQEFPKKIRFVVDVSASMYRFNETDKRLERLLMVTLLIMETFSNFPLKFSYSIVGHSGDSSEILFVDYDKPPQTMKERLKILQKMVAHSEYCTRGDSTLEAINRSIENVRNQRGQFDDRFVFVISDGDLNQYNLTSTVLTSALMKETSVNAHIIFIAQSPSSAEEFRNKKQFHFCLDTSKLPQLMKQIFSEQIFKQ